MDLSKKNPDIEREPGDKPDEVAQLDPLVELLIDLDIIESKETSSLISLEAENQTKTPSAEWEESQFQLPPVLALPPAKEQASEETEAEKSQPENQAETDIEPVIALAGLVELLAESEPKNEAEPTEASQNLEKAAEEDPFRLLQNLLVEPDVSEVRDLVAYVDKKVANLEHQIYEPAELMDLILPLIAELLSRKVSESKEDVVQAIAPIIDKVIENRTVQDRAAMSDALAPLISAAITRQISRSPQEIAIALAPTMGTAIKEQISLERDAMVDALYPVIGSTIAKYLAEAIKNINDQISNAFSVEGISRKIRAKIQGVSEGELILKECIPFVVQAVFLIHKGSGLIIANVQNSGEQQLEADMIGGMLTAIRSFVNDCIAQSGEVSELDAIDYGMSQIVLEVAGYCYLAVVTQGNAPKEFIKKMRLTMETIVLKYGQPIESFEGDPSSIPDGVPKLLKSLIEIPEQKSAKKPPIALIGLSAIALSLIAIPWGIHLHRSNLNRRIEADTANAIAANTELSLYRLNVKAENGILLLSGTLPSASLRQKVEQIARQSAPNFKVANEINTVEIAPTPQSTEAEIQRVAAIFNQRQGVKISSNFHKGQVILSGTVTSLVDRQQILAAFKQIPGIKSIGDRIQLQPTQLTTRIFFELGKAELTVTNTGDKINQVQSFLTRYPNVRLKIIGHSDPSGSLDENQRLALERAKTVQDALLRSGIDRKRLEIVSSSTPPLDVDSLRSPALSRVVRFEPIYPPKN